MAEPSRRPRPDSPFVLERLLRLAKRDHDDAQFASEEEFLASMDSLLEEELHEKYLASLQDDPQEMAQELAFQAYEAEGESAALEMADRALALDPENVDAMVIKAFLTAEDAGSLIEKLEHAATSGENALGEEFFAEFMGDFWPMVEARPYLRCIKQLAEILWSVGRRLDAIAHYENLMDLDPGDHLGNASLLLGNYLAMGEVQRAWDLLEEVDDEVSAVHNWAWVLLFLMIDDEEGALHSLDHALDRNSYVAPLLMGMGGDDIPDLPPVIEPGTQEEAHLCLRILGEAWTRDEPARWWLLQTLQKMGLVPEIDPDLADEDELSP